jgi:hypothetical protein
LCFSRAIAGLGVDDVRDRDVLTMLVMSHNDVSVELEAQVEDASICLSSESKDLSDSLF